MEDLYGIAFNVETAEMDCDFSDFPEVVVASTEEQAVDFAKRISAYCKFVIPFRNSERREKVDWHYIKEHEIAAGAD
jgi:hypothetical protein